MQKTNKYTRSHKQPLVQKLLVTFKYILQHGYTGRSQVRFSRPKWLYKLLFEISLYRMRRSAAPSQAGLCKKFVSPFVQKQEKVQQDSNVNK